MTVVNNNLAGLNVDFVANISKVARVFLEDVLKRVLQAHVILVALTLELGKVVIVLGICRRQQAGTMGHVCGGMKRG